MKRWRLLRGDCLERLAELEDESVDSVVCDPPYAEVARDYGRLTEDQWWETMILVVKHVRRVLKPTGSAVFILQPNSEFVGRMRPWVFDFMSYIAKKWNLIQDVWWWNHATMPTVHCHRSRGLLRPSLKACVWAGEPSCIKNQSAVLWEPSDAMKAVRSEDRMLRTYPSGQSRRPGRMADTVKERGGVTPFNVLPVSNTDSGIAKGHSAATPLPLCEWWVKYITPPKGLVLDPFTGSGSTGVAAIRHGFRFIGIEKEKDYYEIALRRLRAEP